MRGNSLCYSTFFCKAEIMSKGEVKTGMRNARSLLQPHCLIPYLLPHPSVLRCGLGPCSPCLEYSSLRWAWREPCKASTDSRLLMEAFPDHPSKSPPPFPSLISWLFISEGTGKGTFYTDSPTVWPSNPVPRCKPKRNENSCPQKGIHELSEQS